MAEPAAIAIKLRETAREERVRLAEDYETLRFARLDLDAFRSNEGLTRPARPPRSTIRKAAPLFVAAALEVAVNAAIFSGGDQGGIFGAVLKVLVIPVANMGGAFLWTYWIARHVLRRTPAWRLLGLFGCIWTALWLFGLNLAVAHWRESAEAVISLEAAQASFQDAWAHPLALHSYESWGLFLIGCAAGIVAIVEGWTWRDPHPGYSRRSEHLDALTAQWWSLRQEAVERLEEIRETNTRRLADAQRRAEIALSERPSVAIAAQGLQEDVRLFADHLKYVCEELSERYREANTRGRSGERPPQFAAPLPFIVEIPLFPALTAGETRQVAGRLSDAIREINAAYGEACASIPSPDDFQGAGAEA